MLEIGCFRSVFHINELYQFISYLKKDYMLNCAAYDLPQPGEIVHMNWGKSYAFFIFFNLANHHQKILKIIIDNKIK